MSEFDFLNKSRSLLRQLNWYLFHIAVYLGANIFLVLYIYKDIGARWPLLFVVFTWAILIILHGLKINNRQLFRRDKKNYIIIKSLFRIGGLS